MNCLNNSFKGSENVQAQRCAITSRLQLICGHCLHPIWFLELTYHQVICGDTALRAKAGSSDPYFQEDHALKITNATQTCAENQGNVSAWNFQMFAVTTEIAMLDKDVAPFIVRVLWQELLSASIFSKLEINARKTTIVLQLWFAQKVTTKEILNALSHTHKITKKCLLMENCVKAELLIRKMSVPKQSV